MGASEHRSEHAQNVEGSLDTPLSRSLLQKAIRRGNLAHALFAGVTLWSNAPHLLARSLLTIALEEVGVADLCLVGRVVDLVSAGIRNSIWPSIAETIEALAVAPKCQAAADLMTVARWSSRVAEFRTACADTSAAALIDLVGQVSLTLEERAVCSRFLAAGPRGDDLPRASRRAACAFFDKVALTACDEHALEISRRAYACNRPGAAIGLALLATMDEAQRSLPPASESVMTETAEIGGAPCFAFDRHTLIGAWALTLAAKTDPDIKGWLRSGVRWWENNLDALGYLLFVVEGKDVRLRQSSAYGIELHHHVMSANIWIRSVKMHSGLELMKEKLPVINDYRQRAFELCIAGQR